MLIFTISEFLVFYFCTSVNTINCAVRVLPGFGVTEECEHLLGLEINAVMTVGCLSGHELVSRQLGCRRSPSMGVHVDVRQY